MNSGWETEVASNWTGHLLDWKQVAVQAIVFALKPECDSVHGHG